MATYRENTPSQRSPVIGKSDCVLQSKQRLQAGRMDRCNACLTVRTLRDDALVMHLLTHVAIMYIDDGLVVKRYELPFRSSRSTILYEKIEDKGVP